MVNKKPKKNSTEIILVRTGLEGKKPNRTEINRLQPIFGSIQKL